MKKARGDITYCTCENCIAKCCRHVDNYEFEDDRFYCFQNCCEEKEEK